MRRLRLLQQQHHSKLCLIALLGLVLYTISLNCSETIILTPKDFSKIKIRFDFAQPDESQATKADSSPVKVSTSQRFDQELVTSVLNEKLLKLQACLQQQQQQQQPSPAASTDGAGGKASSGSTASATASSASASASSFSEGIIQIEPFSVAAHRAEQYSINASLDTIQVTGVSHFITADIASNGKSRKVSALLRFPDIRISLYYKVSGQRVEDKERQLYSGYLDKGKITYAVHGWRTALSGKVVNIVNRTRLELAGFGMRSHYDFFESTIESFVHGGQERHNNKAGSQQQLIDISKHISKDLLKKVINAVDDRLESTVLEQLDVHEMATWSNFRDAEYEREEEGSLLMMESKVHEEQATSSSRRRGGPGQSRRKRQVPCEVGEELDEYVDSLFRFVKRLVRVMEPFALPNATIELEEYNLQIFLHSGGATRAYTFERKKPAWVLCQNETTTLGLTVGIEEARIHYKYRVIQDWRLLFDGDLEAQIRRPKAQVQITQLNPPENDEESESDDEDAPQVQQRIDKLKVWKPGQIVVLIRGLGNLSSALSMIINQMLSDTSTIDPIIEMIETDGVVAANDLLRNVSIPIFSII